MKYFDCTFADLPEGTTLPGESLPAERGRVRHRVAPASLDAVLKQALGAGGRVVQVQPWRLTLEEVLVDEIQHPEGEGR